MASIDQDSLCVKKSSGPTTHTDPNSSALLSEDEGLPVSVGWVSQLLVSWMSPLLSLGHRRPIQSTDLPPLRPFFQATTLKASFGESWKHYTVRTPVGKYALLWAALRTYGGPFYAAGLLKLVGDICAVSAPWIVRIIIKDLKAQENRMTLWMGIALCVGIFVLQMINTLTVNAYFTITMQTGLKVRTAVSALMYEKALRLSGKARQTFSQGQIVNLMSTDSGRLDLATSYVHYIWSGPFQIVVILIFLFYMLNWTAFVGFAFLVIGIPLQSRITTSLSKFRKVWMHPPLGFLSLLCARKPRPRRTSGSD